MGEGEEEEVKEETKEGGEERKEEEEEEEERLRLDQRLLEEEAERKQKMLGGRQILIMRRRGKENSVGKWRIWRGRSWKKSENGAKTNRKQNGRPNTALTRKTPCLGRGRNKRR